MSLKLHRILGPGIRLSAESADGERRPVWIQAAVTGTWKGHPSHPKITFTADTFQTVIDNFHANPAFKPGADGVGTAPVVRLDYEHTSEMQRPLDGDIPRKGLPAPGFIWDLALRAGGTQLWALVDMGEQLWDQVSSGAYKWTSVAIDPLGVDRVSGEPIGHVLTSLAITNNPFILGMEDMTESLRSATSGKIAASLGGAYQYIKPKRGSIPAQLITCALNVWGEAETPDEALVGMRDRFNLPSTCTAAEVMLELVKLEELLTSGSLDASSLVLDIKSLLDLPVLSTPSEVVDKAKAALLPLVEKEASDGVTPPSPPQGAPVVPNNPEIPQMKTLTARLAPTFKLSAEATEDDVVDAARRQADAASSFKSGLVRRLAARKRVGSAGSKVPVLLSADETDEGKILNAVDGIMEDADKVEEAQEALDAFEQLKSALGAGDLTELLAKATKLTEQAEKYGTTVKDLNALKAKMSEGEVKDAEEEIAAIAACHKASDSVKRLMLTQVIKTEMTEDGKEIRSVRAEGLQLLRKEFPLPDGQSVKQLLTSTVFAGKDGMQLGGPATGLGGEKPPTSSILATAGAGGDATAQHEEVKKAIHLCAGLNEIEQTVNYLDGKNASFKELAPHRRTFVAGQFYRTGVLSLA